MTIYFDNNATAPIDPRVKSALLEALASPIGNPSSPHSLGQAAKAYISEARRHVANYLKVKQSEIIFTSGGSEGAFLCIHGLIKNLSNAHVITSEIEHQCVYELLQKTKTTYLPVNLTGTINPEDLKQAITKETSAIILMAANNETGVKLDLAAISNIARDAKIPLIVDGVSLLAKDKFEIPSGVSAMFFSGHKIHAPQGVGFIYLKKGLRLEPQIQGGAQEFGMRGGTENMLGIIGLSKAIQILDSEDVSAMLHMQKLRDLLESALLELPGVKLNGTGPRICNTTNLSFSKDGETLLITLDQMGISVSLGSACSSGAIEPSRVLLKMGVPQKEAQSSIRFSLSRLNTMDEVEHVIAILQKLLKS